VKRNILVLALLILAFAICANADIDSITQARPAYASDLIKIKLSMEAISRTELPVGLYAETPEFGLPELDGLLSEVGGTAVIRAHRRLKNTVWEALQGFDRWFLIRLNGKMSAEQALAAFKTSPLVEDAIFEHYAYPQITPNDGYYAQNWGHNNTGQGPGGGGVGFDSNAPEAWDQSQAFGSPDIIIAIIDSGVNYNHVDLAPNCIPGYDFGQNDNNPMDTYGHGTSCAGVAAGRTNNGIGVAGVAGGCSIMPVKVMNSAGDMGFTAISNAITYAADNEADVISMSLGAENGMQEGSNTVMDAALYYAYNAGVVIFAATANSNTSAIAYPANHTAVISVGAASPTGQRKSTSSSDGENWWGSNYGVNIQDDPKAVDIMAATILPATTMSGSYMTNFNGTSCATPYAAGVGALILSKDSGLTPAQVREAIVTTATDMTIDGGAGWDRYTGYGMINASAALETVAPGMPSCIITAPANNSAFDLGSVVTVAVTSADTNGTVSLVSFYIDDSTTPAFTDDSAPYVWDWDTTGQTPWQHEIKAIATDNENNSRQAHVNVMLLMAANEGFESGGFDLYPWVNTSASPWIVQSTDKYSGIYAAKAGTITHNQNTSLSLSLNITEAGTVSFFDKVSSEANYDYFRFFIDGVQQAQWSGSVNWALQSYPVNPGTRTFTWTYFKDQGVNSGSDTAWLDHIIFPPHNAPPDAPSNLVATAMSPSAISLSWTDNSNNETEFHIESLNGGFWSLVNWTSENVTTVANTALQPLTEYSFRVMAYNANGESTYSNVASATTLGTDCPDNVTAAAVANQVNISWTAPPAGCDGYEVWRYTVINGIPATGVLLTPVLVTSTSFTDADWHLQNAGDYLWEIVAVSNAVHSAPSLSNPLDKVLNGVILGSVTNLSNEPIENATVSCGTLSATTNTFGVYVLSVLPGSYSLIASHPDYESVSQSHIIVSSDQQVSANFQLPLYTVAAPAFNPEPGSYTGEVDVILSCSTEDAEIRWTLDGSDPTQTSELYSAPISLEASATIKARAYKVNCTPSAISTGIYDITVANSDPVAPVLAGIQSIYPNPANASANIRLYLKDDIVPYILSIYNIKGELVQRFTDRRQGDISLTWNGKDSQGRKLASGIYLIRLENGELRQTRKVVLK
jgi:hypothetical protein